MIRLISVDDRLLHGQVAFHWADYLKLDTILVLNDEAANDEFTKMILGLAKPRDIRLIISEVEKGIKDLDQYGKWDENVMIILGNLFDAGVLFEHHHDLNHLNIGGLRARPNSIVINDDTTFTVEDFGIIKRLLERRIRVTVRHSPKTDELVLTEERLAGYYR